MPMCQAHRSDVPRMAEVLAASFEEEELHARLFPYRKEYPNYVDAWRRLIWEHWWDYSRVFMVSYVIEDEKPVDEQESDVPMALFTRKKRQENEVLVGVAEWKREGPGGRAFGTFQVGGIQLANRLHDLIIRDRSAARSSHSDPNPLTMNNFEQAMYPFIKHHFSIPPYRRNHWSLCILGVHPHYQYRGIGRDLVAWGLRRARTEGIPAAVIGSKGKDVFYRRCGFDLLVGWATEGFDANGRPNPLGVRGIGGGCILFTRVKEDDDEALQGKNH